MADAPVPPSLPDRPGPLWVGSIVIDCTEFDRMYRFWSAALRYVARRPPSPGWVVLSDPSGRGPNVSLNLTKEPHLEDYRLHLDLYSTDPLAEVERLTSLGARLTVGPTAGHDYVTMADPDGNLFDVIDVNWPDDRPDWSFGRKA